MTNPVATDNTTSVATLVTSLGGDEVAPLSQGEWNKVAELLRAESVGPAALHSVTAESLVRQGLKPATAERVPMLLRGSGASAFKLASYAAQGLWAVSQFDVGFPRRLKDQLGAACPPMLFGIGDIELLDLPSIGVVGSRDVSEEGAAVAREIGSYAARRQRAIVSGGARGVDREAMNGAATNGGVVVAVLADSLSNATTRKSTRDVVREGRALLLSLSQPETGFAAWRAKARDKVIYALADVTVVVASAHGSGGTWDGARQALKMNVGSVAVWMGDGRGPGNEDLGAAGAREVRAIYEIFDLEIDPGDAVRRDVAAAAEEQLELFNL